MGDHRASIKIEINFHGIEEKVDWWINYCDSDGEGLDRRVKEFFSDVYYRGMIKYDEEMLRFYSEQNLKKVEAEEKETLRKLKNKYEAQEQKQ